MEHYAGLDITPPAYSGSREVLDKDVFRKSIDVLAIRSPPGKVGKILKSEITRKSILDLPRVRTVVSNPRDPDGDRLVLLRASSEADLAPSVLDYLKVEAHGFENFALTLDYDYWTADDILRSFFPPELREGSPSGFAIIGHVAHLNINAEYLPYKHVIGQIILDKNKRIRTVVNKLDTIDHQFRFFKMELIAGEPDYIVEHHESNCRFTFDFTQVYWNSRLHTEHDRLIQIFQPHDVVADVFAGVGPFAVPAGVKGCGVLANDLNPNCARYLKQNVQDNRVSTGVRVYCEDGRDFIRRAVTRCFDEPFLPYTGSRMSRTQEIKVQRRQEKAPPAEVVLEPRRRISHFVMNLPDSGITFLDAFRGILADDVRKLEDVYDIMPMVHCHCFTRELERERAEADILQRVSETLGHPVGDDVSLHLVRSVAPGKEMYCISFRLPREVAFGR
ncbi:hypothetical protein BDN72DRAFT_867141 [Pluteus cervinus]|uniref:Uncharacterized protein n=1 Tax=Pluteus cervinus TaxID=181527 RepID=A0ACD3BH39_9AGAR|nr:hypothetical protein BDN72DRAFT_867141 [Pluteus cervinus]